MLAELDRTGGRKVPDSAPDGFIPIRFRDYLAKARQAGDVVITGLAASLRYALVNAAARSAVRPSSRAAAIGSM